MIGSTHRSGVAAVALDASPRGRPRSCGYHACSLAAGSLRCDSGAPVPHCAFASAGSSEDFDAGRSGAYNLFAVHGERWRACVNDGGADVPTVRGVDPGVLKILCCRYVSHETVQATWCLMAGAAGAVPHGSCLLQHEASPAHPRPVCCVAAPGVWRVFCSDGVEVEASEYYRSLVTACDYEQKPDAVAAAEGLLSQSGGARPLGTLRHAAYWCEAAKVSVGTV